MANIGNHLSFIGRLTKDIELKTVGDSYVTNFTLARNKFKSKDAEHLEANFLDCVAWGKQAEVLSKYVSKGDRVGISASVETRVYENQKYKDDNGNPCKVKVTEMRVEQIELIESKNTAGQNANNNTTNSNNSAQTSNVMPLDDSDELPF